MLDSARQVVLANYQVDYFVDCLFFLVGYLIKLNAVGEALVPDREGNPINYNDFSRRAWKAVT